MAYYFSTTDGTIKGRSSHAFVEENDAITVMDAQNARAESLGIKARYKIGKCERGDLLVNGRLVRSMGVGCYPFSENWSLP